mgnify:CR=1 FL=1|jgi:hypothetical protein
MGLGPDPDLVLVLDAGVSDLKWPSLPSYPGFGTWNCCCPASVGYNFRSDWPLTSSPAPLSPFIRGFSPPTAHNVPPEASKSQEWGSFQTSNAKCLHRYICAHCCQEACQESTNHFWLHFSVETCHTVCTCRRVGKQEATTATSLKFAVCASHKTVSGKFCDCPGNIE